MYAIVDIAGQQFKVKKDQKIFVHRLEGEPGNQVDFDRVLLIDNDSSVSVGAPVIQGAMITAKILEHLKGDKVIVFKKRRRKGYRVKNGHRQYMTKILIEEIVEKGAKPKVVAEKKAVVAKVAEPKVTGETKPKAAEKKAVEPKVAEKAKPKASEKKAVEPKAEAKPAAVKKAPAAKKPVAEKAPAAKKPAAKKPAAPKKADGKKK
jgi:large subunit ribosomal protein L21